MTGESRLESTNLPSQKHAGEHRPQSKRVGQCYQRGELLDP